MESKSLLDDLRIASPCPAAWSEMKGDDRVRYCAACEKHVYNVISLTRAEAVELIGRAEGRVCFQLHRRNDGTVLTADCPVGSRMAACRRLRRLVSLAALLAALWAVDSVLAISGRLPYARILAPIDAVQTLRTKLAGLLYRNPIRGSVVVGELVPPPTTPCPPATTTAPPSPGG